MWREPMSAKNIPFPSHTPTQREVQLAEESSRVLAAYVRETNEHTVRVVPEGKQTREAVVIPSTAFRLLIDILEQMAQGHAVALTPVPIELTTQQAADLLHVSRPHLVKLLNIGKIPHRKVGTHRRVLYTDVIAYKQRIDGQRRATLDALAAQAQELKLGYE